MAEGEFTFKKLRGAPSRVTYGKPVFEAGDRKGLWLLYRRHGQVAYPQMICINREGLVGETRYMQQALRFRSGEQALCFALAQGLPAGEFRLAKRPNDALGPLQPGIQKPIQRR